MVTQLISQHSGFYYLHKGNGHRSTDIPSTYIHILEYTVPVLEAQVPAPQMTRNFSTVGLVRPRATATAQKYAAGHPHVL